MNQYSSVGGTNQAHDSRGNLTTGSFGYNIDNQLTSGPGSAALAYDPAGRLYETIGGGVTTRFLYDGQSIIGEYNGSGALQRRFVHGPGIDEPIVWYEGAGTSDRRWLIADERGSIIAVTDGSGAAANINTYDEYGIPAASNAGRFQYTGQAWLPEVSLHHYRARAYAPSTGRFLQSDPILIASGLNLYAYVGNDPVNATDPLGLIGCRPEDGPDCIEVVGQPPRRRIQLPTTSDIIANSYKWEVSLVELLLQALQNGNTDVPADLSEAQFTPIQASESGGQCDWQIVWPSGPETWNFVASNPIRLRAVGVGNAFNYSVRASGVSLSGNVMPNACSDNGCPAGSFSGLIGAFPRSINQYFTSPLPSPSGLYQWQITQGGVGDAGGVRGSAVATRRGRGSVNVFVHRCGGR